MHHSFIHSFIHSSFIPSLRKMWLLLHSPNWSTLYSIATVRNSSGCHLCLSPVLSSVPTGVQLQFLLSINIGGDLLVSNVVLFWNVKVYGVMIVQKKRVCGQEDDWPNTVKLYIISVKNEWLFTKYERVCLFYSKLLLYFKIWNKYIINDC